MGHTMVCLERMVKTGDFFKKKCEFYQTSGDFCVKGGIVFWNNGDVQHNKFSLASRWIVVHVEELAGGWPVDGW